MVCIAMVGTKTVGVHYCGGDEDSWCALLWWGRRQAVCSAGVGMSAVGVKLSSARLSTVPLSVRDTSSNLRDRRNLRILGIAG